MGRKSSRAGQDEVVWKGPEALRALLVPLDSLHLDPANANTHTEERVARLAASYARFGQQKTVTVDASGVVRAGNRQLMAARQLGWTHLAVAASDLAGADLTLYAVADNVHGADPHFDPERLAAVLEAAQASGEEPAALGYSAEEIDELIAAATVAASAGSGASDPPPAPPVDHGVGLRARWGVEPGGLWEIASRTAPGGAHRLFCGDGTDPAAAKIVGGGTVAILDPPFQMPDAQWLPLLRDPAIVFGQARQIRAIPDRLWRFERVLVKPHAHRSATIQVGHQHAFVAQCGTVKTLPGDRTATLPSVVMLASEDVADTDHPYEKPVAVLMEHLTHWTPPGDVFDPFAGSGSSIIAAESVGRLCHAIEARPEYVALTLQRLADWGLAPRCVVSGTAG